MPIAAAVATPTRDETGAITAFMQGCSLEVTRATTKDVELLTGYLPAGTEIYMTAVPGRPLDEAVPIAAALRTAGFEPVPHIAARHYRNTDEIAGILGQLVSAAGVRKIMLVGGDSAAEPGFVQDALSVIQSGVINAAGIAAISLPGFADGHPVLSDEELELGLVTKTAAAQSAGLEASIVTQFCFDAEPMVRWLGWLRARGVNVPVRLGFAGPTSLMTWLNYARRCGVKASAEALASRSGLIKHAFKAVAPDPLVRRVADALASGQYGDVQAHLFCFGGVSATARWAAAPMRGKITLTREGGFEPADA